MNDTRNVLRRLRPDELADLPHPGAYAKFWVPQIPTIVGWKKIIPQDVAMHLTPLRFLHFKEIFDAFELEETERERREREERQAARHPLIPGDRVAKPNLSQILDELRDQGR